MRAGMLCDPLAIILVTVFVPAVHDLSYRRKPTHVIAFVQTSATFLTAAWLSMIGAIIFAETIVASEHLRAWQPGQPADQAGHALCRHRGCHRVLDPRGG